MSKHQGTPTSGNVIYLFDDSEIAEFQPAAESVSAANVLQSIISNPRFSAPANDEPKLSNLVKLAPRRRDCRQARLLCLWAEILADDEIAL